MSSNQKIFCLIGLGVLGLGIIGADIALSDLPAVRATVLGVPFLLALLGRDEIVVGAALSLIAGLGDLMPPTAMAGLFAAQVVGIKNYFSVLKVCLVPAVVTAIWGIMVILGANWYPF